MTHFVPHRVVWTMDKSIRFRVELLAQTGGDERYFQSEMNESFIRFARLQGTDFTGQVLELGWRSERLGGTRIEGIPTALDSEAYSSAFVVETIEGLPDDELRPLLRELYRALRRGGTIVIATPNQEKLAIGETVCPDCGSMFHRTQHVRSWTASTLAAYMSESGFQTVAVTPWYLDKRWWRSRVISMAARAVRKRLPHLIYIGRKAAPH
jgi:hypothetical protein